MIKQLVLLRYVTHSARDLTKEELEETMTRVFEEQGGDIMSTIAEGWIEEGVKIGVEKGEKKGVEKAKLETARELVKNGVDIDVIARSAGLSRGKIEKLAEKVH